MFGLLTPHPALLLLVLAKHVLFLPLGRHSCPLLRLLWTFHMEHLSHQELLFESFKDVRLSGADG